MSLFYNTRPTQEPKRTSFLLCVCYQRDWNYILCPPPPLCAGPPYPLLLFALLPRQQGMGRSTEEGEGDKKKRDSDKEGDRKRQKYRKRRRLPKMSFKLVPEVLWNIRGQHIGCSLSLLMWESMWEQLHNVTFIGCNSLFLEWSNFSLSLSWSFNINKICKPSWSETWFCYSIFIQVFLEQTSFFFPTSYKPLYNLTLNQSTVGCLSITFFLFTFNHHG